MAIGDQPSVSVGFIPEGREEVPPPTNTACMPDIYNKLDANAIEKTKVLNAMLTTRLQVQERVLTRCRAAAELRFERERDRLRLELRNIFRRMPNYADIPHLETKVSKLKTSRRRSKQSLLHDCVFTTEPLDMKGLADDKSDKPFCDRFFDHHAPRKTRLFKDALSSIKKGESVPDLRMAGHARGHGLRPLRTLKAPFIRAQDDNFVSSKSFSRLDDDDDTKTV